MKIVMIGTGYVGLVSGCCFSEFGFNVICVDNDHKKIDLLNKGSIPIYEPGLPDILSRNVKKNRLLFTKDLPSALNNSDAIFIAVGTPPAIGTAHTDLSNLAAVAKEIAPHLHKYTPIIIKSTVPIGTTRKIGQLIIKLNPNAKFDMVSNPEFLREGSSINDFMRPDRIIVGLGNDRAKPILQKLYRPLYIFETPTLYCDLETSEMIKYASNSFLATKIAFINEISDLCERVGADIQLVASGIGLDGRIGKKFLHPGPGYGGSCFPKDTNAFIEIAKSANSPLNILESVAASNIYRKQAMVKKIINACNGTVVNKEITILGLAFKPNTDDIRESPALTIIEGLYKQGANITAYDPIAMENTKEKFPSHAITWANDIYTAIKNTNAIILVTEWNEFRSLDLNKVKSSIQPAHDGDLPVLIDLRNIYTTQEMSELNIRYVSIGRPNGSVKYKSTTTSKETEIMNA